MKISNLKYCIAHVQQQALPDQLLIRDQVFKLDNITNLSKKIIYNLDRSLLHNPSHPLYLLKHRIKNYFYKTFVNYKNSPLFSIHDNLNPIVTIKENFDDIMIPETHPSRKINESYYINANYLLRTHTSVHQIPLIRSGLNSFLVVGDVYRRDSIDSQHYPIFHQLEGVKLFNQLELFQSKKGDDLQIFPASLTQEQSPDNQEYHTIKAAKLVEFYLKSTLEGLIKYLFNKDLEMRWVPAYFPFTHPSWELEILHDKTFIEILGCGIMQHAILKKAGVHNRIGWAFGLGLERLAMLLYKIPDIRLFWSTDTGFLSQFQTDDCEKDITLKPISRYPQCINDISFWLPNLSPEPNELGTLPPQNPKPFEINDFLELIRNVTCVSDTELIETENEYINSEPIKNTSKSTNELTKDTNSNQKSLEDSFSQPHCDIVEQVNLIDEYKHPVDGRTSRCFRIIYRHPLKTLTKELVNKYHKRIEDALVAEYGAEIR